MHLVMEWKMLRDYSIQEGCGMLLLLVFFKAKHIEKEENCKVNLMAHYIQLL